MRGDLRVSCEGVSSVRGDCIARARIDFLSTLNSIQPLKVHDLSHASALSTRSRELPDYCPFQLLEEFANKFVERWEAPADTLLGEIFRTLRGQLDKIISQHFPDDTHPVLSGNIK